MKKRNLLVMAVLVVAMGLAIAVPASAWVPAEGCTPGYWKQPHHLDSWEATGYSPEDLVSEVFCWDFNGDLACYGPDNMTLLDALWLRGGGENAFLRHAVAALLNAAHPDVAYADVSMVMWDIRGTYRWAGFEHFKDEFEEWNELGCPLD